jgi:hypothetical protein
MAIHKLFFGGQRTANPYLAMLPQVAPAPDAVFETDNRHGPVLFSPTRWMPFGHNMDEASCASCGAADCRESKAINQYVCSNEIVDGDSIDTHIIPRYTEVRSIWWMIDRPIPGLSIDLEFRDITDDMASVAIPIPGGTINAAVAGSGIIHLPLDGTFYFPRNGLLRATLNGVPAAPPPTPYCTSCGAGGLQGFSFFLSPEIFEPCRGLF